MPTARNASEFALNLEKIAEKVPRELVADATKKIALDLFSRIVMKTPVASGRLRGNWHVSIDSQDVRVTEETDKAGRSTISAGAAVIQTVKIPTSVWLQNNLAYAGVVEGGSSKQAPSGMVAVSLAEIEVYLK